MVERQIKLFEVSDVQKFVNAASRCDFDIDVFDTYDIKDMDFLQQSSS